MMFAVTREACPRLSICLAVALARARSCCAHTATAERRCLGTFNFSSFVSLLSLALVPSRGRCLTACSGLFAILAGWAAT